MIAARVRVLVLGASGMIGRAIQNEARRIRSLDLLPGGWWWLPLLLDGGCAPGLGLTAQRFFLPESRTTQ
jgi:nucleoside-diphosphate-sugar epimerase